MKKEMALKADDEYEKAFKIIRRKRNQLSVTRHNTYMSQLNRKHNKTFEQMQEEEQEKLRNAEEALPEELLKLQVSSAPGSAGGAAPSAEGSQYTTDKYGARIRSGAADVNSSVQEERLLALAGGDFDMVATGKIGMELRTVLAQRALHVKKRLHENAVNKGEARRKKNVFFKTEILPFFQESYQASSSEEDEDEGIRKAKLERRMARAKLKEKRKGDQAERDEVVERFREQRRLRGEYAEI